MLRTAALGYLALSPSTPPHAATWKPGVSFTWTLESTAEKSTTRRAHLARRVWNCAITSPARAPHTLSPGHRASRASSTRADCTASVAGASTPDNTTCQHRTRHTRHATHPAELTRDAHVRDERLAVLEEEVLRQPPATSAPPPPAVCSFRWPEKA
eukprot:2647489-Rhodomonas_salina.4